MAYQEGKRWERETEKARMHIPKRVCDDENSTRLLQFATWLSLQWKRRSRVHLQDESGDSSLAAFAEKELFVEAARKEGGGNETAFGGAGALARSSPPHQTTNAQCR